MTRTTVRAAVAGTLTAAALAACAAPAVAAPGAPAGHHDTATIRALTDLMRRDVAAGAPGVSVRIDDGRHTVALTHQAGWTRRDHTLSADDQFRMGSNTKTMIGVLALQLVAEHRLALTDPVNAYLPGAVPGGSAVTVRMLLDHTSGLADYIYDPSVIGLLTGVNRSQLSPRQLVALAAARPLLFTPGSEYAYSNTDYVALGLVLEHVTGRSVECLLQQRILGPLHLRDTYFATDGRSRDGRRLAAGYEPDAAHVAPLLPPGAPAGTHFAGPARGDHVLVTSLDPSWSWAAGAVVSTQADEQTFLRAVMSGRLLPRAQQRQLLTTVVEDPSDPNSAEYGAGIEEYHSPCGAVWGHTGGIPGYATENYTDPTGTRSVSVATTTLFGLHDPVVGAADQRVVDAAVCAMFGRPLPTNS